MSVYKIMMLCILTKKGEERTTTTLRLLYNQEYELKNLRYNRTPVNLPPATKPRRGPHGDDTDHINFRKTQTTTIYF